MLRLSCHRSTIPTIRVTLCCLAPMVNPKSYAVGWKTSKTYQLVGVCCICDGCAGCLLPPLWFMSSLRLTSSARCCGVTRSFCLLSLSLTHSSRPKKQPAESQTAKSVMPSWGLGAEVEAPRLGTRPCTKHSRVENFSTGPARQPRGQTRERVRARCGQNSQRGTCGMRAPRISSVLPSITPLRSVSLPLLLRR